jgi:hypothetical protein
MNKQLLLVVLALAAAPLAPAANTLFVSGSGSDSNPCNAAQPCRTFAGAYAKGVLGGTIMALDSADFTLGNTFNIGYPLTIDGGAKGAFATGPLGGAVINIYLPNSYGSSVIIRNLTLLPQITDGSVGIFATVYGAPLKIENVNVNLPWSQFSTNGILAQLDPYARISLRNVSINGATPPTFLSTTGIGLSPIANSTPTTPFVANIDRVTCDGGILGLQITDGSATIHDSTFQSAFYGISVGGAQTTPTWLVERTQIVDNRFGLVAGGGGTIRLSDSVVSGNMTGLEITGGTTIISFRNNVFAGNGADGSPVLSTSLR